MHVYKVIGELCKLIENVLIFDIKIINKDENKKSKRLLSSPG